MAQNHTAPHCIHPYIKVNTNFPKRETIKSTITKITINGKKKIHKKRNKIGEREREREREGIDLFTMNNLEGIWERERGGNEVKRNY